MTFKCVVVRFPFAEEKKFVESKPTEINNTIQNKTLKIKQGKISVSENSLSTRIETVKSIPTTKSSEASATNSVNSIKPTKKVIAKKKVSKKKPTAKQLMKDYNVSWKRSR